jgi:hypothetical protein
VTADHAHATTPQSRIAGQLLQAVGERNVPSVRVQICVVACPHGRHAALFHPVMLWLIAQLGVPLRDRVGVEGDGESFVFELLTGADLWSEPTSLSAQARSLRIRVLAALAADHAPPPWAPQSPAAPERVRMLVDALLWLDDLLDYNL